MPLEDLKVIKRERNLDQTDVEKLSNVVEETGTSSVPFPVNTENGDLTVVGDANITKREPQTYRVKLFVEKATSLYTEKELREVSVEFDQNELEYHVVLEIQVDKITIDMRESMSYAIGLVLATLYEQVEHEDGKVSMEYITDPRKRSVRALQLVRDREASALLKEVAIALLDLPEGLQAMTTSQATEIVVDFMLNNPDLVNETDSNLD